MATPREIKKRINSVKNTKKITRTMEMVATAKSKKISNKVNASMSFSKKIQELIETVYSLSADSDSALLRKQEKIRRAAVLVITSNRGLCGGYNSNVIRLAIKRIKELSDLNISTDIFVIGKKGVSALKYAKIAVKQEFTHIDDKAGYEEALQFSNLFLNLYKEEKVDLVEVVSTVYHSSGLQKAEITQVFPFEFKNSSEVKKLYKMEPDSKIIVESLLPMIIHSIIYKMILHANCSEQIARRIAMKSASDAATDMIKLLTRGYNRIRQAKITQEISEIVAGADSLN